MKKLGLFVSCVILCFGLFAADKKDPPGQITVPEDDLKHHFKMNSVAETKEFQEMAYTLCQKHKSFTLPEKLIGFTKPAHDYLHVDKPSANQVFRKILGIYQVLIDAENKIYDKMIDDVETALNQIMTGKYGFHVKKVGSEDHQKFMTDFLMNQLRRRKSLNDIDNYKNQLINGFYAESKISNSHKDNEAVKKHFKTCRDILRSAAVVAQSKNLQEKPSNEFQKLDSKPFVKNYATQFVKDHIVDIQTTYFKDHPDELIVEMLTKYEDLFPHLKGKKGGGIMHVSDLYGEYYFRQPKDAKEWNLIMLYAYSRMTSEDYLEAYKSKGNFWEWKDYEEKKKVNNEVVSEITNRVIDIIKNEYGILGQFIGVPSDQIGFKLIKKGMNQHDLYDHVLINQFVEMNNLDTIKAQAQSSLPKKATHNDIIKKMSDIIVYNIIHESHYNPITNGYLKMKRDGGLDYFYGAINSTGARGRYCIRARFESAITGIDYYYQPLTFSKKHEEQTPDTANGVVAALNAALHGYFYAYSLGEAVTYKKFKETMIFWFKNKGYWNKFDGNEIRTAIEKSAKAITFADGLEDADIIYPRQYE